MHEAVPAIAACGISPIVRIPDFQSWMIKSELFVDPDISNPRACANYVVGALDSGAHGVRKTPSTYE